jgi:hypothetical protein
MAGRLSHTVNAADGLKDYLFVGGEKVTRNLKIFISQDCTLDKSYKLKVVAFLK